MKKPCSALWPTPGSEGLHWRHIVGAVRGSQLTLPFLLAIRGAAPGDSHTHQPVHRPAYDDTFVLLRAETIPHVFRGATHAYQRDSKLSPDEDGDGRGDVGSIRAAETDRAGWYGGRYVLRLAISRPHPIFTVETSAGSSHIPAHRDFDHNGVISEAEAAKSEALRKGRQANASGCYATAVLMHTGFDAPPDAKHRSSIACLTAPLPDLELMARSGRTIEMMLVNAWDLVPLAEEAQSLYGPRGFA